MNTTTGSRSITIKHFGRRFFFGEFLPMKTSVFVVVLEGKRLFLSLVFIIGFKMQMFCKNR